MNGMEPGRQYCLKVSDYDLAATLDSGQAFRWRQNGDAWEGVIHGRWVRLNARRPGFQPGQSNAGLPAQPTVIEATTAIPQDDWSWLTDYLQSATDLGAVVATFPMDPSMQSAVAACGGLRLLRQDLWECLASFICSSTKQIVQIRQIVESLSQRFGDQIPTLEGKAWTFPTAQRIAGLAETDLRECKLGFRAPYVLAAARAVAEGRLDLEAVRRLPLAEARAALVELPGVGRKIADCVLLFGYGFPTAFPVDVWIFRALRELYFPKRKPKPQRLLRFTETYFGPHAGYAQQYLFHYMRKRPPLAPVTESSRLSSKGSRATVSDFQR
jgi:N-glycosylase/DNA lyase